MPLELMATSNFGCPLLSDQDHMLDGDMELHSTPMEPIKVADERLKKYVAWEYEHIGRALKYPFKRCQQQMIQDKDQIPVFTIDRISVRDTQSVHHVFYFDISVPINQERDLYEKAYADMKAGKPIDPEIRKDFEHAEKVKTEGKRVLRLKPIPKKEGE